MNVFRALASRGLILVMFLVSGAWMFVPSFAHSDPTQWFPVSLLISALVFGVPLFFAARMLLELERSRAREEALDARRNGDLL